MSKPGTRSLLRTVTFGWGVPSLGDLAKVFFQVGDDVLEAGDLGGMLRGAGLDSECEAVDELAELRGGYVRVRVDGQRVRNGGTTEWRRRWRAPAGEDGSEAEGGEAGDSVDRLMERADMAAWI